MKYLLTFVVMYFLSSASLKCRMGDESEWYKIALDTIVGETIDSSENIKYDLFSLKKGFISAEIFYHRNITFIEVVMRIIGKKENQYDSTFFISFYDLVTMVEKVQFNEEIKSGEYKIGSRKPVIAKDNPNLSLVFGDFTTNFIPFSIKGNENNRERFTTIKYLLSIGLAFRDTKSLNGLSKLNTDKRLHIGGFIDIPIYEGPDISFRVGTNSVFGENINTISISLLYKLYITGTSISGIFGIGYGHTEIRSYYDYGFKARKSYPVLCVGFNLIKNWIDVLSTIAITEQQSTVYNGNRYNIDIAGIQVNFYLIL